MKAPARQPAPDPSSKKATDRDPRTGPHPEADRPRWPHRLWPAGVLILLAAACFAPLIFSPVSQGIAGQDVAAYLYWLNQYTCDELLAGHLPLWNPYIYCGVPYAANPHVTLFYPPSWLYLLVPVTLGHKLMIAVHSLLAGLSMYLFLRNHKLWPPAVLAGCLPWMFGSYLMAHATMGHLTLLFTMIWLPIALCCYDRAIQTGRWRWLFWSGLLFGMQLLAGEPQSTYYSGLILAVYSLVRGLTREWPGVAAWHPRRYLAWAASLAFVGLVAALAGAVQLLPTAEFAAHSDRSANTFDFVTVMSFPFSSFLGLFIPWSPKVAELTFTGASGQSAASMLWEFAVYVGILPLVLAAASCVVRRQPSLLAARLLLVLAVVLMLGAFTPAYAFLFTWLPGLRFFRMPARAILILLWAVSVMAAFGADWLLQAGARRWQTGWFRGCAVLGLAAAAAGFIVIFAAGDVTKSLWAQGKWELVSVEPLRLADPLVLRPLICMLACLVVVIALSWLPRRWAAAAVVATIAADLLLARPAFPLENYSTQDEPKLQVVKQYHQQYAAAVQPFRFDLASAFIAPDETIGIRVENVNGRWPMALRRFYRFVHLMRGMEPHTRARHQLPDYLYATASLFPVRVLNVRFASHLNYQTNKMSIREDPNWLPRAWLVDCIEVIPDEQAVLNRMSGADFNPATTVIIESPPRLKITPQNKPVGSCRIIKVGPGHLEVETRTDRDAYLVLSEIFYPGWKATVDGKEVPLEPADYVISALPLPAGTHRIACRYQPASVTLGAACTTLAALAAVVIALCGRRPKRVRG